MVRKHGFYFGEFVLVVGGEDEFHFRCEILDVRLETLDVRR